MITFVFSNNFIGGKFHALKYDRGSMHRNLFYSQTNHGELGDEEVPAESSVFIGINSKGWSFSGILRQCTVTIERLRTNTNSNRTGMT